MVIDVGVVVVVKLEVVSQGKKKCGARNLDTRARTDGSRKQSFGRK